MLSLKVRNFYLMRHTDVNGLSGTGVVAVGSVSPFGEAIMWWVSIKSSFEMHKTIEALMDIHGHHGATELIWGDPPEEVIDKPKRKPRKKKSVE